MPTNITRFDFSSLPKVTMMVSDETNEFMWIGIDQNSDGNCILRKVGKFNLNQVYFSINKSVTKIIEGSVNSSNIYVAYNDSSLLGERLSLTNPLTSTTQISIPVGITESPVDVKADDTNVYYLIPGSASGTNAKILRYNTSGVLQETIDLTKSGNTVTNATSIDIASNGDIWAVTNNNPAEYVRVFELSGGGHDFTVHNTI